MLCVVLNPTQTTPSCIRPFFCLCHCQCFWVHHVLKFCGQCGAMSEHLPQSLKQKSREIWILQVLWAKGHQHFLSLISWQRICPPCCLKKARASFGNKFGYQVGTKLWNKVEAISGKEKSLYSLRLLFLLYVFTWNNTLFLNALLQQCSNNFQLLFKGRQEKF